MVLNMQCGTFEGFFYLHLSIKTRFSKSVSRILKCTEIKIVTAGKKNSKKITLILV